MAHKVVPNEFTVGRIKFYERLEVFGSVRERIRQGQLEHTFLCLSK